LRSAIPRRSRPDPLTFGPPRGDPSDSRAGLGCCRGHQPLTRLRLRSNRQCASHTGSQHRSEVVRRIRDCRCSGTGRSPSAPSGGLTNSRGFKEPVTACLVAAAILPSRSQFPNLPPRPSLRPRQAHRHPRPRFRRRILQRTPHRYPTGGRFWPVRSRCLIRGRWG